MLTFRTGFVEPIFKYATSIVIPNAIDAVVSELERVRNDAARTPIGCVRSSPIEKLRELLGLQTMRTVAVSQAAKLFEKAKRFNGKEMTPRSVSLNMESTVRIRTSRYSFQAEKEACLAKLGLLQLARASLPREMVFQMQELYISTTIHALNRTASNSKLLQQYMPCMPFRRLNAKYGAIDL
eukprot:gb/GEZJ01003245.1/.p2 GENE.gb/GEZJ01003245.1/~~gb/GEZJ01003245.1/.p2  ORF type:complete len:182 (-),score=12.69 gb/GEZJ01003245.1/:1421-1966(-)